MYLFTCIRWCKRDGYLHAYTHTHQGVTHTLQESQHLPAGCHTHRRAHPQKKEKVHTQISREFRAHTDSYLLRDTQIGGVINYGKTSHQKWVTKKNPASSVHTRICTCTVRMREILRRIHMCDMTHSYVWHDSFIQVTWLIHTCDMTRSWVERIEKSPEKFSWEILSLQFLTIPENFSEEFLRNNFSGVISKENSQKFLRSGEKFSPYNYTHMDESCHA